MIVRPRNSLVPTRKLSARVQARLATATLRAARTAAESDRCLVAEGLFVAGNLRLQAAGLRAKTKGAMVRALDAGREAADAGQAIVECQQREQAAQASGAPT